MMCPDVPQRQRIDATEASTSTAIVAVSLPLLVWHLIAESDRRQSCVVEMPRVVEVLCPAGGGDGPVWGAFERDVTDDEERGVWMFPGMCHFIRGEDIFGLLLSWFPSPRHA